ncbi:MAG: polyprenyl diphosphate synthase [archaeon]|jgi:tritrans,polycis-undecaprenyl-diphosphate synthase [geranylgeranyl-diphosphate specific]
MLESIAFIPDGNRRYAKLEGITLAQSYMAGTNKAWDVIDWLSKYPSITTGTFYTFSLKNFNRSKTELSVLMKIFEKQLDKVLAKDFLEKKELKINFIGRRENFPKKLQEKMSLVEKKTVDFNTKTINLALGYDGQTEIVDATKKFATAVAKGKVEVDNLSPESFSKYLYADFKAPDLIVRTSNEYRLSGFLTYQASYSELAFIDKYWPQLTQTDVEKVVEDFNTRERRFGK